MFTLIGILCLIAASLFIIMLYEIKSINADTKSVEWIYKSIIGIFLILSIISFLQ